MNPETEKEFIEKGADLEHNRWARWYRWQRDNSTPENIERWNVQAETPYSELSETEKESDRKETRQYLSLISRVLEESKHTKDLETAIIRLASALDRTPLNLDLRSMATMYIDALSEQYKSNYIKYLEDKLYNSIDRRVWEEELDRIEKTLRDYSEKHNEDEHSVMITDAKLIMLAYLKERLLKK